MPALDGSALPSLQHRKSYKRGIPLRHLADFANGCST
jgi:SAM-dependent methyltransferase